MARYKCPSCGASYNGKRCRACLYEHFTEEVSHGAHVHEGEPLVIDAPVRRPVQRKDPFGCEKKTRKGFKFNPAMVLAVILVLNSLGNLIFSFARRMEAGSSAVSIQAEREPAPFVPEDALFLGGSEDMAITVLADWQDGQELGEGFEIYVRNAYPKDVAVTVREVIVNGCLLENASFYCTAYEGEGSVSRATFSLDEEELAYSGIGTISQISFRLWAYSLESYETLLETEPITLNCANHGSGLLYAVPDGVDIYSSGNVRLRYLGFVPHERNPENVLLGKFLFYVENETDQPVDFYAPDVVFNQEHVSQSALWTQLPAHTRTVTPLYLYGLEKTGIQTPEDLQEMSFTLEMGTGEDLTTAQITIPLS